MNRQLVIHSVYWIGVFVIFTLCYSFIGSISQGLVYAGLSLPLVIAAAYLFIHWAIPSFLFKGRNILFALLTTTIFLAVLNLQIVFVLLQRIHLAENILSESTFVPWDILYSGITALLFALPAITYETVRSWDKTQEEVRQLHQNNKKEQLEVKSNGKTYRIVTGNIHFIESYGDYAHIHLSNQKIVTRMTLKKLERLLADFVRVHRSYIVNPNFCRAFNRDEIIIREKRIPLAGPIKKGYPRYLIHNRMITYPLPLSSLTSS